MIPTRSVLWDSSAILASLDADDADHAQAVTVARQIASKLGRAIARQWLLTGGLPVVRATPAEEQSAKEILARRADKDWTLCDAISFAILEARRIARAFSFDPHLRQYGRIQVLGLEGQ